MKNNSTMMMVIVAVVVGALAFFGGMKYQQNKAVMNVTGTAQNGQSAVQGQAGTNARGFQRGANRAGFGGATFGSIISQDANSITVKMQDGSSKIVNISDTTTVSKTDTGSKTDLKTGETVMVTGSTNTDGSVSAKSVQINPRTPKVSPMPQSTGAAQ